MAGGLVGSMGPESAFLAGFPRGANAVWLQTTLGVARLENVPSSRFVCFFMIKFKGNIFGTVTSKGQECFPLHHTKRHSLSICPAVGAVSRFRWCLPALH